MLALSDLPWYYFISYINVRWVSSDAWHGLWRKKQRVGLLLLIMVNMIAAVTLKAFLSPITLLLASTFPAGQSVAWHYLPSLVRLLPQPIKSPVVLSCVM